MVKADTLLIGMNGEWEAPGKAEWKSRKVKMKNAAEINVLKLIKSRKNEIPLMFWYG